MYTVDAGDAMMVDHSAGSATLNAYTMFPANSTVTYYYEYSTDPTFMTSVYTTPKGTFIATGADQPIPFYKVDDLPPGTYYYKAFVEWIPTIRRFLQVTGPMMVNSTTISFVVMGVTLTGDTLEPTRVNSPAGSATLNGYIGYPDGDTIDYWFELADSMTFAIITKKTATKSLATTGAVQYITPEVVSQLATGPYYVRLVTIRNGITYYYNKLFFVITGTESIVGDAPATHVDSAPGVATLNGYVSFPVLTSLQYFFQYFTDCTYSGNSTFTAPMTAMTTSGVQQLVNPVNVTDLSVGNYCYRLVVQTSTGKIYYGPSRTFKITGVTQDLMTIQALVEPSINNTVIFVGTAIIPLGLQVYFDYQFGTSLDQTTWITTAPGPTFPSMGTQITTPIEVSHLPDGQYYYQSRAVVNPGTQQEYILYGDILTFTLAGGAVSTQLAM